MAEDKQSPVLRVVVLGVAVFLIGTLAYLLFKPGTPPPAAVAPGAPTGASPTAGTPQAPGTPVQPPSLADAGPALGDLVAKVWPAQDLTPIGGLISKPSPTDPYMQIEFNPLGAGIKTLKLGAHRMTIEPGSLPETLQETVTYEYALVDAQGKSVLQSTSVVPFAMIEVAINGKVVPLAGRGLWKQTAPGAFEAEVDDAAGKPILKITRVYKLQGGRYDLVLDQQITNLSGQALDVRTAQFGAVDLPTGVIRYGGDPRRARVGYLPGPQEDPTGQVVHGRDIILPHASVLGKSAVAGGAWTFPDHVLWPNEESVKKHQSLAWFGLANRFFAVTSQVLPERQPGRTDLGGAADKPGTPPDKRLNTVEKVDRLVLTRDLDKSGKPETNAVMALRAVSPLFALKPGESQDTSIGIYAGPVRKQELTVAPLPSVGLDELEVYSFGSCAWCTFQPVAYFLRSFLTIIHNYLTFDWALAIILLVVCVRTLLHPITKWSQTSLQRFGKQMQRIGPKQKAIQEKFKNDPTRMREEVSRLMREEQVSYAGMLGCIPMFFQTPIWIGLSSLMFFFFDLRHTPAFFGVIQTVTGGRWHFLADLAEPDRFLTLPAGLQFTAPIMGLIDSVNLLPIILGIVFFIQQKYLTPPPTTQMSPEMETQTKIMKVMMVFMFPLMMYNAPSGLALYFITNSTLGIIESKYIRRHFEASEKKREEELARNPKAAKYAKVGGPTGFFGKLMQRFSEAQARAEMIKRQREAAKSGSPPQGPQFKPPHLRK